MKKLVNKFGKYNVAAFIVMAVGLILWFVVSIFTPEGIDMIGFLILVIGLVMWVGGFVVRLIARKTRGDKVTT